MPHAVVTGMIATYPVGGVAWDYGQYVLGLERLGWTVTYLEDPGVPSYDPHQRKYDDDCSYGLGFLQQSLRDLGGACVDAGRWHYRSVDGRGHGMPAAELDRVVADADLLLNVSGSTLLRRPYTACRCKALLDTDPGYNHLVNWPKWDASPGWQDAASWRDHDHFFTYAQQVGRPGCTLPDFGMPWRPTVPLVVVDAWEAGPAAADAPWTTVMTWNNFRKPLTGRLADGTQATFGTKEAEFDKIASLPQQTDAPLELAVGGGGAPLQRWRDIGWRTRDSHAVSADARAYRDYIRGSRGELSVAKQVYVATGSGWFSCRTVCYLAAGRPAVVQDTGWSGHQPSGEGLVGFTDADSAAEALRRVRADHAPHAAAARDVARQHFAHDVVLGDMLRAMGLG
jgi:hypothetical protein